MAAVRKADPAPTLTPVYKPLNWSVKIETDLIKLPELKGVSPTQLAGAFDAAVEVAKADKYIATETPVPFTTDGAAKDQIVILVLKADPATPKDMKPLRVSGQTQDDNLEAPGVQAVSPTKYYRELGVDGPRATLVYVRGLFDWSPPTEGTLFVVNENPYPVKILLTVAYGPPIPVSDDESSEDDPTG